MVLVPKLFMLLWISILLTLYMALWAAAGMPIMQMAASTSVCRRSFSARICHGVPSDPAMQRSVSTALAT